MHDIWKDMFVLVISLRLSGKRELVSAQSL